MLPAGAGAHWACSPLRPVQSLLSSKGLSLPSLPPFACPPQQGLCDVTSATGGKSCRTSPGALMELGHCWQRDAPVRPTHFGTCDNGHSPRSPAPTSHEEGTVSKTPAGSCCPDFLTLGWGSFWHLSIPGRTSNLKQSSLQVGATATSCSHFPPPSSLATLSFTTLRPAPG